MIEIIPNWHPLFVHFTIALYTTSVIFYVLAYILSHSNWRYLKFFPELEVVARWCLWLAALISIATVSAGIYAYYTVKHDAISHVAMTIHRNWALLTASLIFLLGCWLVWRYFYRKTLTLVFILPLIMVQGLLLTTAWYGGELVYRYGTGVLSLPSEEEMAEHHHH